MIKKIANKPIKTPIRTVVPQPGATLPYSEFNGFKAVPNAVTFPPPIGAFARVVMPVAIALNNV